MINPLEVLDLFKVWNISIFNVDAESIKKAAEEYKETGIVVLKDILNLEEIENYHNFLLTEMPKWWWNINYFYYQGSELVHEYKPLNDENIELIKPHKEKVWKALSKQNGGFSYIYKRTIENHFDLCDCGLCKFQNKFYQELKYILAAVCGKSLEKGECFTSMYEEGDFNGYHHDKNKGELAFVLHLSKGWEPGYGGEFMSFSDDGTEIEKCVAPSFNKLVIMKLNRGEDIKFKNHMVTRVNAANWCRLSMSGWWKE